MSERPVTPIFLFSTARSGSTLLQRILGSYPEISTVSEPWLLMPLAYAFRRQGVYAEYEHATMVSALEGFCEELPGGRADFQEEVRQFVTKLYERQAGPRQRYFLDKTPPYFLLVEEILELFPEAKFIFLWRSPLAVAASLADWPQRNWGGLYRENLFFGLAKLIEAYQRNAERCFAVRFEDYVTGDEQTWRGLMDYLGLAFEPDSLEDFAGVNLRGAMGDKHGSVIYDRLSPVPLSKWHETLANPLRRTAARRYLYWIGEERLRVMGYDARELHAELDALPWSTASLAADSKNLAKALLREPLQVRLRSRTNLGRPSSLRYVLGARRRA